MPPAIGIGWWDMPALSLSSQETLFAIARQSLRNYLEGKKGRDPMTHPEMLSSELLAKRGCFVTLKKYGALRGCIGTFVADQPLYQAVARMAAAAAFDDPRFPRLSESEFEMIKIEISILGELERMGSPEELEVGRHGILVKSGKKSGTFLPEVAVEQHWSRDEFIRTCAREKAGLSPEEFERAEFFLYRVDKIAEKE